jgi:signal transduction histidine kinase
MIAGPNSLQSPASGLRLRVLLPLSVSLIFLLVVFVVIFVLTTKRRQVEDLARTATSVDAMFREQSRAGVEVMRSIMQLILQDRSLEAAFRARDRDRLFQISAPILSEIRTRNHITHFYYILPDTTMLLRVQAPGKHSDKIGRFVLHEARRTGQPFWGNEQGPLGTFTLRVAYPWISEGEVIGYLEMGIEFEDIMNNIKSNLDVDVFVAIDKDYFDRAKWEEAQKQRPFPVPWDEFPSVVVLSRTTPAIPPPITAYLGKLGPQHVRRSFEISWDGNVAQIVIVPFSNLRRQELGELIVVRDITTSAAERLRVIVGVPIIGTLIGAALILFFYALLGRVQTDVATRTMQLAETQRVLSEEQFERQRAERELRIQQERNELLEARNRMVGQLAIAKEAAETALRENEKITTELRATQSELLTTARKAGMAEIANNVLHNVGNVLNSVNVSAGLIHRGIRDSKAQGVIKAVQLMDEHAADLGNFLTNDEKGKLLPGYLKKVTTALANEHQSITVELQALIKNIDHIKDIVATQQSYAGSASFVEPAQIESLLDDALRMHAEVLARQQVTVVKECDDLPPLLVDKSRLLQILVNLIGNAIQALEGTTHQERHIALHVNMTDNRERLRIDVEDNGEGIAPENLPRLFIHGFTTRKGGHGFGLHSCALAAQGMGGTLTVKSDGQGMGALFTLELPIEFER